MQTQEKDLYDPNSAPPELNTEGSSPLLSGYDSGPQRFITEPSYYLALAAAIIGAYGCFSSDLKLFFLSAATLAVLVTVLYILAERFIFRGVKELKEFRAPFEGVFVLTLGSLLPGLILGACSLSCLTDKQGGNIFVEACKIAFLLSVPFFNFLVWKSVRKGYLSRPRLTALMNGFALGSTAVWSIILLSLQFNPENVSYCKFGWMLLITLSPIMLIASVFLGVDLWFKSASNIRRITVSFSLTGAMIAAILLSAPYLRSQYLQGLIETTKSCNSEEREAKLSQLRKISRDEDLLPAANPIGGLDLSKLLIKERGIDINNPHDADFYFTLTGRQSKTAPIDESAESKVFQQTDGLLITDSQFHASVDTASLTSTVDLDLRLLNQTDSDAELLAHLNLPKGAVISRATAWVEGASRECVLGPAEQAQANFVPPSRDHQDPLIITESKPNSADLSFYPVARNGGNSRLLISFKIPLKAVSRNSCELLLPDIDDSNFKAPKRHKMTISSTNRLLAKHGGLNHAKTVVKENRYLISGIFKSDSAATSSSSETPSDASTSDEKSLGTENAKTLESQVRSIRFERKENQSSISIRDPFSKSPLYITQQELVSKRSPASEVALVIDTSASMRSYTEPLKELLNGLSKSQPTAVYFTAFDESEKKQRVFREKPETAVKILQSLYKDGGEDNAAAVKLALENTSETSDNTVIWVHGPQPQFNRSLANEMLELAHPIKLLDYQISGSKSNLPEKLQALDYSHKLSIQRIIFQTASNMLKNVEPLLASGTETTIERKISSENNATSKIKPNERLAAQISQIWAKEECEKLEKQGEAKKSQQLALAHGIISANTGAVVLENPRQYKQRGIAPRIMKLSNTITKPEAEYTGLIGQGVDPRYGQSNIVGMLADYGYDTARDIVRCLSVIALIIGIGLAFGILKSAGSIKPRLALKALTIALLLPGAVHLLGTWAINNYGGLGGGL
ncbi:MAG: VWA domain-containing protein [Candidatus Obscuribacterales bacterium]|nr:VWA domain-containing protein [Candidatus Obscuribacterales bacterium]